MPLLDKLLSRKHSKKKDNDEDDPKKGWSWWWIVLIILAIVILVIIAICVYSYMSTPDKQSDDSPSSDECHKDIYDTLTDDNLVSCDYDTSGDYSFED